jgi:hypothetical protein
MPMDGPIDRLRAFNVDVDGTSMVLSDLPFDESVNGFKSAGFSVGHAQDLAKVRIVGMKNYQDHNSNQTINFLEHESYVAEGVLMVPKGYFPPLRHAQIVLYRNSLLNQPGLLDRAIRKDDASGRHSLEFSSPCRGLELEAVNKILEYAVNHQRADSDTLILENTSPMISSDLRNDERGQWLFGNSAEEYGFGIDSMGWRKIPFFFNDPGFVNALCNPYIAQMRIMPIQRHSTVIGSGLQDDFGTFTFGTDRVNASP